MFGREICGHWDAAIGREWLVTNGLGGYACGTVSGANTRRYHGFLMASLAPPVERTLLVSKVDVTVNYRGSSHALSANEFEGGIDPLGFVHLESFAVRDGIPTWRYAIADALIEQRVFMAPGANTTYLRLALLRAAAPLGIEVKPLVTYRDYHSQGRGARPFRAVPLAADPGACSVHAFDGARPYRLALSAGTYVATDLWNWNFLHREEAARGLDALEDLWGPGVFHGNLTPDAPLVFTATADEPSAPAAGEPGLAADAAMNTLIGRSRTWSAALPTTAPPWVHALATAADQFIVRREVAGALTATVIAGYPWFTDWGRDTMIALPGLTTTLGRFTTTAAVLRTFAHFVDRGMVPNRFADASGSVEYNTADATLWMFQALNEHLQAAPDPALVRELFPTLRAIIHAHAEGTRFHIGVDPADGLLTAGEAGLQVTWMDAKHGDRVFTPRIGKAVEINALWLNALDVMVGLAAQMQDGALERFCRSLRLQAGRSFERFWNPARGCLYDVIDVDGGTGSDASIRPNQIFAVSLPYCVLPPERMKAVVDVCASELLVSHGLRTLNRGDPAYRGRYAGGPWERDAAYHQGTVWGWLLGPFARAHHRVYGDAGLAQSFLAPIAQHLADACVGSVSEVFDGDAPHTARGCFAQAWSVAEILRSWVYLEKQTTIA